MASRWWRLLLGERPRDGRVALRVVNATAAAGDPASAIMQVAAPSVALQCEAATHPIAHKLGMTDDEWTLAVQAELARLGLDWEQAPVMLVSATTGDEPDEDLSNDPFLAHLRTLGPGASWREVFELPAHWDLEDQGTWLVPYHPLGPLDYQVLPTGPALLLAWPATRDEGCLAGLCARATAAAFPLYATWHVPLSTPSPERLAYVVLPHDTTDATLADFQAFVAADAEARVWAVQRTGRERYQA